MKKAGLFLTLFISVSLITFGQTSKAPVNGRPTEQQEIKADKHLEKELQQKQLTAKPEQLFDTSSDTMKGIDKQQNMKKAASGSSVHAVRRNGSCHKKPKQGNQKN